MIMMSACDRWSGKGTAHSETGGHTGVFVRKKSASYWFWSHGTGGLLGPAGLITGSSCCLTLHGLLFYKKKRTLHDRRGT
jgi:hypothetical protein